MKKCVLFTAICLAVVTLVGTVVRDAAARPAFRKEFLALYVKDGTPYAEKVIKANCNVCHEGMSKKDRNPFGQELAKLLTKDDQGNPEKIQEALKKVADMKSKAGDDASPTFGQLIEKGELPGGEPK